MLPACSNNGGRSSLLQLSRVPQSLEEAIPVTDVGLEALSAWRARPGEIFSVVDPAGSWYRARLQQLEDQLQLVPFAHCRRLPESPLQLTVCQALPDKERFELVLEKLTELGVSEIVPFQSEHSLSLEERDARQKKSHRWPDLLVRAAKQCRRGMIPALRPVLTWDQLLYRASQADLKLMLYEGETGWRISDLLDEGPASVALIVGPEGGFSDAEVAAATALGIVPVSVGPRILRTETAAIAAAALLQHRLGDLC